MLRARLCCLWFLPVWVGAATNDFALYESPALGNNEQWMYAVEEQFIPLTTNDTIQTHISSKVVDLKGQFSLTNRNFRVRIDGANAEVLAFDFQLPDAAYRLELNRTLGNFLTLFRDGRRLIDDHGRWYAYRDGLLDFRISDAGQLSLARGPVPFLNYDLGACPTNLLVELRGRLSLFQHLSVPLPQSYQDPYAVAGDLTFARVLSWKLPARERYRPPEDGTTLLVDPDGSVTLRNPHAKDARDATATFNTRGPTVVTCRIEAVSDKAGLAFASYNKSQRTMYAATQGEQFVLCSDPFNEKQVAEFAERGLIFNAPFFLRAIYGLDFIRIEASQDGLQWMQFENSHLNQRYLTELLYVQLRLPGRAEGAEQFIRVSHADVQTFSVLGGDPLVNRWGPAEIKQGATSEALQDLLDQPGGCQAVVDAVRELLPFCAPSRWRGQTRSINPELIMRRVGHKMMAEQVFDALPAALDTWYDNGFYLAGYQHSADKYHPPALVRAAFYQAWLGEDWGTLRREAHRYATLGNPTRYNQLATWMVDQADAQLFPDQPAESVSVMKRLWPHPLRMTSDRSTMNLVGELQAVLADGEIDRAARILTHDDLSDAFINTQAEPDLYRPATRIVSELLEAHPALQEALVEDYSAMGMIRVGRAEQAGDAGQLALLARQFSGTPASRKALALLADRDFSMGNFSGAAEHFALLIPAAEGATRTLLVAKLSLAEVLQGKPPTYQNPEPVALPGKTYTAAAFSNLLAEIRAPIDEEIAAVPAIASAIPFAVCDAIVTNALLELPFRLDQPIARSQQGHRLALQQHDQLVLVDLGAGTMVHQSPPPASDHRYPNPFRPIFVGEDVITTIGGKSRDTLMCFSPDGATRWSLRIQGRSASDPVLHQQRLYLLTRSPDETLYLNRLHPKSGVIEAQHRLIRHARLERTPEVIRPAFIGDQFVFATRGLIMACDDQGQVRWIRRMPYIASEADPQLLADQSRDQIVALGETRAVLCTPCSPYVVCVDLDTGRLRWQHAQPDRQYVYPGLHAGQVLLQNQFSLVALDPESGKPAWRLPMPEPYTAVIPRGRQPLLQVRLDAVSRDDVDSRKRHFRAHDWLNQTQRALTWHDPANGHVLTHLSLPLDQAVQGDVVQALPDGNALYLITGQTGGAKGRYPKCQLVRVTPDVKDGL